MQKILKSGFRWLRRTGFLAASDKDNGHNEVDQRIRKAQSAWFKHMNGFKNELGIVILPDKTPELTAKQLANCKVVPNREFILQQMKKGSIVAEVGVQEGHFSKSILGICEPKELHLIDYDLAKYGIEEKFKSEIKKGQVVLHESDSSLAISKFPNA